MNETILAAIYQRLHELDRIITAAAIQGMQDKDGLLLVRMLDEAVRFASIEE